MPPQFSESSGGLNQVVRPGRLTSGQHTGKLRADDVPFLGQIAYGRQRQTEYQRQGDLTPN
jgi:hypothetical protein